MTITDALDISCEVECICDKCLINSYAYKYNLLDNCIYPVDDLCEALEIDGWHVTDERIICPECWNEMKQEEMKE